MSSVRRVKSGESDVERKRRELSEMLKRQREHVEQQQQLEREHVEQEQFKQSQHVERDARSQGAEPDARVARGRRRRGSLPTAVFKRSTLALLAVRLVQLIALVLFVVSVIGTFYAWTNTTIATTSIDATLTQLWTTIVANLATIVAALVVQALLALLQYGSSSNALQAQSVQGLLGWGAIYLLVLTPSVLWNWDAYGSTLVDTMKWPIAWAIVFVIAADVLPEIVLSADD